MSEVPKEAPVRKYLPSSVYLEEKTDEQKKEEVLRAGQMCKNSVLLDFFCNVVVPCCCFTAFECHGS